jgi:hypothetical protein
MRRTRWIVLALVLGLPTTGSAQQSPEDWDPARLQVTRPELEDLASRYEAIAASSAYSGGVRGRARTAGERIRERLEAGDFDVGDRIALQITGESEVPDTVLVEPGPSINLPNMGRISLEGVLRSELQDHLVAEISRFVQNPQVRTSATIRLQFRGTGGQPGFHTFPSDLLLSDAIMQAGGLRGETDWDEFKLARGDEVLMEGEDVEVALADGRSLDHLGLQNGDIIEIPAERPSQIWPRVIRFGLIAASSLLLGFRVFF